MIKAYMNGSASKDITFVALWNSCLVKTLKEWVIIVQQILSCFDIFP